LRTHRHGYLPHSVERMRGVLPIDRVHQSKRRTIRKDRHIVQT
jgi:hypothetical protein